MSQIIIKMDSFKLCNVYNSVNIIVSYNYIPLFHVISFIYYCYDFITIVVNYSMFYLNLCCVYVYSVW